MRAAVAVVIATIVVAGSRRARTAAVVTSPAIVDPVLGLVSAAMFALFRRWSRLRDQRRQAEAAEEDVGLLGELTLLGVSAGMTFVTALEHAGRTLSSELGREVSALVRQARQRGAAHVLATAEGRGERLYRLAGRAVRTGAPISGAVQAFVDERRADTVAAQLEAARKLPVKLLFPLALFVLPGFLLLLIAPAVVSALDRLGL